MSTHNDIASGEYKSTTSESSLRRLVAELQAELELYRRKFSLLLRSTSRGVIVCSRTDVLECNSAAVELFGASGEKELMSANPMALFPLEQTQGTYSQSQVCGYANRSVMTGPLVGTYEMRRLNGERFAAETTITGFTQGEEAIFLVTIREATDPKVS